MATATVLVLGGGIGGVVVAHRAKRYLGRRARVVVVDRDLSYRFAPSYTWVMTGMRRPAQVVADLRRLRRRGIELVHAEVLDVDTDARVVKTSQAAIGYDRLVVALGIETVPDAMPGFGEAAHDVYSLEGAARARQALQSFDGGHVVVLVSGLPFKCPAAPYEVALLAEAELRRRGLRGRFTVEVVTPEPAPMPSAGPAMGEAVESILAARGIAFRGGRSIEGIDPARRELIGEDGTRTKFDLLLGVPPQASPEVARRLPFALPSGFLAVDPFTLATTADGVHAIGDVTAIPIAGGKLLPKAGVFAHAEAEVVARRIAHELDGRTASAAFDGKGSCFLEVGDGKAAFASGYFYEEEGADVRLRPPSRTWHLAKIAFEQYWLRRWF